MTFGWAAKIIIGGVISTVAGILTRKAWKKATGDTEAAKAEVLTLDPNQPVDIDLKPWV